MHILKIPQKWRFFIGKKLEKKLKPYRGSSHLKKKQGGGGSAAKTQTVHWVVRLALRPELKPLLGTSIEASIAVLDHLSANILNLV